MMTISATVKVDVSETTRLRRNLHAKLRAAVQAEAFAVQADAQQRVPVLTGTLRRSIRAEFPTDLSALIAAHVDYAPFVEFGTHRMAARPYLTPAGERARIRFPQRIRAAVQEAIGGA